MTDDPSPEQAWSDLALTELRERREALLQEIGQLETRRGQIQKEIETSFAGQADAMARRIKGFQDYLVGALQDLAVAAEQVELVPQQLLVQPSPSTSLPQPAPAPNQPPPGRQRVCSARMKP